MTKALPIVLFMISCAVPDSTRTSGIEPENAIVAVESRCVDTLRTFASATKSVPPVYLYRDIAYLYQVQIEIDLQSHERFPKELAVAVLTADDSLSLHILNWKEAIDISPTTATFSFLLKTTSRGKAYFLLTGRTRLVLAGRLRTQGYSTVL